MPRQAWKSRWAGGGGGGDSDTFFSPLDARPEKVAERGGGGGGLWHFFFFPYNFLRHLHYWVGVPSVYQTDLRGWQAKKKIT